MIGIVDYGLGNMFSVVKAIKRLDHEVIVSSDLSELKTADKLILPGVGHFGKGMKNLQDKGLVNGLKELVIGEEKPILGICLGMQLLLSYSEESESEGLHFIDGKSIRFQKGSDDGMKIPHLGWNNIHSQMDDNILLDGIGEEQQFYFAHSYHAVEVPEENILGTTTYGNVSFTSAIRKKHIFGSQFHPEKSHDQGLKLLQNFIEHV